MAKADPVGGGTAPAPPALCESHSRDAAFRPPPARPRAEPHPGTRASRPHPYFWLEVAERQRNVAGRQPPRRSEPRWQGPKRPTAPFRVDPSGGDGQRGATHCAGGTPAFPGGPSSTQQTGNMIDITPRNRARRRLQAKYHSPSRGSDWHCGRPCVRVPNLLLGRALSGKGFNPAPRIDILRTGAHSRATWTTVLPCFT